MVPVGIDNPRLAPHAEAYRRISIGLEQILPEDPHGIVAVTSPLAAEGKTTTAANLAAAFAHSGRRVLAVSFDLRRPRLHRMFGADNEVGIADVLAGRARAEEAEQTSLIDNLRVIASGHSPTNPGALLSSSRLVPLLEELRRHADLVIADTSPLLPIADASLICAKSDAILILAHTHVSKRDALEQALEELDALGRPMVAAVLNGGRRSSATRYGAYYYEPYP